MKTEFNLSKKRIDRGDWVHYSEEDVKEFIRLILKDLDFLDNPDWREACARIEKRAGDKLKTLGEKE